MFPERLRRATLLFGAVAAFGIAEQSAHPSPLLAGLPGAEWPGSGWWSIWVLWNIVAGVGCAVAFFCWPRRMLPVRVAVIIFAGSIWARSSALFIEYDWALWGTVARNIMTSLLIVGSWSWSGDTLRKIDRAKVTTE